MRSCTLVGSIFAVVCILHLCSALPIQLLPAVRKGGGGGRGGGSFGGSRGGFGGSKGGFKGGSTASKIGKKGLKRAGAGAGGISDGNDTGDEELCFPGSAKVYVQHRGLIEMRTVKLGDCVEDASNEGCSRVYAFSHRVTKGKFNFVQIESKAGRILKLTKGHYIYVNGELKAARDVRVGDVLQTSNGTIDWVRRKTNVQAEGLFNPQTFSGDIVVDGLRASTFTEAVRPGLATPLLAPLRIAFAMCGIDASAGVMENTSWVRQIGVATLRTINLVS